jgi:outer membrane protein OmpA-like peptidoglycan-associated protein
MNSRIALALGILLLLGAGTFAQEAPPKVEITVDYSYLYANPQNNQIIPAFNLNGGGGGGAYYINKYIGIEAEFEGYSSRTHYISVPASLCPPNGCTATAQGNLFTYNVGPIVKWRFKHIEPFVETMFGGAHSNLYANLFQVCTGLKCTTAASAPSNNAFDFIIGGGFDVPVNRYLSIRPMQMDYVLTRFGNALTAGNNNQSNFRYQAGFVFRFGGAPPPPPNRPPVASCSANPTHTIDGSGDAVVIRADASDPDGDPLTYAWTATGGTVDGTGSQVRWTAAGAALGAYTITSRVSDGRGGTASCAVDVTIDPRPNRPPIISCSASPSSVHLGGHAHITADASDPDGDPLTYSWDTTGGQISGTGKEVDLDTTGLAPSTYTVNGHVNDGRGGTADCRTTVTVEAPPAVEAKLAIRSIYFPTAQPMPNKPDKGLVESQQRTLTSLAKDFKEYLGYKPDAHLELQGHADHRGTPEYNQALSERRVALTKSFLVGLGIPEASLSTKAFGEEDNMTQDQVKALVEQHPNLTQEQRDKIMKNLKVVTLAQNRRVDITLVGTGQQSVRQFPFNAEDALTLLDRSGGKTSTAAKTPPAGAKKKQ